MERRMITTEETAEDQKIETSLRPRYLKVYAYLYNTYNPR